MGLIDNIKEVYTLVKAAGTIELQKKVLDLQSEALELQQEHIQLKQRFAQLEESIKLQRQMIWDQDHNWYWRTTESGQKEGPYCPVCYDNFSDLVRLSFSRREDRTSHYCKSCTHRIQIKPSRPPS